MHSWRCSCFRPPCRRRSRRLRNPFPAGKRSLQFPGKRDRRPPNPAYRNVLSSFLTLPWRRDRAPRSRSRLSLIPASYTSSPNLLRPLLRIPLLHRRRPPRLIRFRRSRRSRFRPRLCLSRYLPAFRPSRCWPPASRCRRRLHPLHGPASHRRRVRWRERPLLRPSQRRRPELPPRRPQRRRALLLHRRLRRRRPEPRQRPASQVQAPVELQWLQPLAPRGRAPAPSRWRRLVPEPLPPESRRL